MSALTFIRRAFWCPVGLSAAYLYPVLVPGFPEWGLRFALAVASLVILMLAWRVKNEDIYK